MNLTGLFVFDRIGIREFMTLLLKKQQLINVINALQKRRDREAILKNWFKLGNQILRAKNMLNKGMYVK
jgi:hypothetical protein